MNGGGRAGAKPSVMHGSMMGGPELQGSHGLEKLGQLSSMFEAEPC